MAERLYRSMKEGRDGKPEVGRSARALGVRPGVDILVKPDGTAVGGAGGMSVAPDSVANLPRHRRPPEHGGTGKDPLWEIGTADLGADSHVPRGSASAERSRLHRAAPEDDAR